MPSLLHLDERLLAIPEDDCCTSSGSSLSLAGGLPVPPAPPRRWVDALEAVQAARPSALPSDPERPRPMRKCASTPTLHSMSAACAPAGGAGEPGGMEVYVVLRCFKEFGGGLFNRLPGRLRYGVRDAGICHYLAVFKQRDGSLVQFDFGPRGGDIHVARGPFAFLSKSADGKMQRLVPGEVRERRLSKLPDAHMYVGRTPLTLQDIRAWNTLQEQGCMDYELHKNDCRHYINCLVKYTTGQDSAASSALRHQWQHGAARGSYGVAAGVVRLTQFVTDLANWGKVQLATSVGMYGALALSGHKALAALRPLGLLPAGARARLQPVGAALARPVRQALVRKPVVVGTTAAVATLAASAAPQAPVLRETVTVGARVATTIRTAAQAALAATSTAVARASAATRHTTNQAVVVAGSLAGAATRGAAGLMVGRPTALEARSAAGTASPLRASLPTFRSIDRSQRLALAITSAARR
ncbi:hypothetical protein ABPG75_010529 [Micractinium tetrahymenae]